MREKTSAEQEMATKNTQNIADPHMDMRHAGPLLRCTRVLVQRRREPDIFTQRRWTEKSTDAGARARGGARSPEGHYIGTMDRHDPVENAPACMARMQSDGRTRPRTTHSH